MDRSVRVCGLWRSPYTKTQELCSLHQYCLDGADGCEARDVGGTRAGRGQF